MPPPRAVAAAATPLAAGLLALGLLACAPRTRAPAPPAAGSGAPGPGAAGPGVVAADGVLCDLTSRIAGPDLPVRCLLAPGDDPHQFRLTPAQKRDLAGAALVLINGYGLTPSLSQLEGAVPVAELAVPDSPRLTPPERPGAAEPGGEDGHGHGAEAAHDHGHGDRDPHAWHDPRQAGAMAQLVGERLARLAPPAAAGIRRRSTALAALLEELDDWNRRQFATIPRGAAGAAPPLATGHRALASLARRYGLRELPVVDGSSSSSSPRPQAFAAVVRQLQEERVPRLFAEQLPPPRSLERISQLSGVPIAAEPLVADGLARGADGRGNLMATLTANTCTVSTGLGGRCDRGGQRQLIGRWDAIR